MFIRVVQLVSCSTTRPRVFRYSVALPGAQVLDTVQSIKWRLHDALVSVAASALLCLDPTAEAISMHRRSWAVVVAGLIDAIVDTNATFFDDFVPSWKHSDRNDEPFEPTPRSVEATLNSPLRRGRYADDADPGKQPVYVYVWGVLVCLTVSWHGVACVERGRVAVRPDPFVP